MQEIYILKKSKVINHSPSKIVKLLFMGSIIVLILLRDIAGIALVTLCLLRLLLVLGGTTVIGTVLWLFPEYVSILLLRFQDTDVLNARGSIMPDALMEAMAMGFPCIAIDCEFGPSELINSYDNSILVPVGDEEKITKAILWLISHEEESTLIGENAKKFVRRVLWKESLKNIEIMQNGYVVKNKKNIRLCSR